MKTVSSEVQTTQLFLGFPVDKALSKKLEKVDRTLISTYIRQDDLYLQELMDAHERYLGKYITGAIDLPELELLQSNIYSLLNKILPGHPYQEQELIILAVPCKE